MFGHRLPDCLRCGDPIAGRHVDIDWTNGLFTCLSCGQESPLPDPPPSPGAIALHQPPDGCLYQPLPSGFRLIIPGHRQFLRARTAVGFLLALSVAACVCYAFGDWPWIAAPFLLLLLARLGGPAIFLLACRYELHYQAPLLTIQLAAGPWRRVRTLEGPRFAVTLQPAWRPWTDKHHQTVAVQIASHAGRLRFGTLLTPLARATIRRAMQIAGSPATTPAAHESSTCRDRPSNSA